MCLVGVIDFRYDLGADGDPGRDGQKYIALQIRPTLHPKEHLDCLQHQIYIQAQINTYPNRIYYNLDCSQRLGVGEQAVVNGENDNCWEVYGEYVCGGDVLEGFVLKHQLEGCKEVDDVEAKLGVNDELAPTDLPCALAVELDEKRARDHRQPADVHGQQIASGHKQQSHPCHISR